MEKKRIVAVACAGLVVVGFVACGEVGEDIGDAMVEAGEGLVEAGHGLADAGESVRDATTDDAAAQPDASAVMDATAPTAPRSFDLACDVVREEVEDIPEYTRTTYTHRYAELRDPSIDPATAGPVGVLLCGRDRGAGVRPQCSPSPGLGRTCIGDPPLAPLDCETGVAEVARGLIRVWCGRQVSGQRWNAAESRWYDSTPADGTMYASARITMM